MIKVGVVGGTGYTGVELLRLLVMHPQVQLEAVTSRAEEGVAVSQLYPNLRGYTDLCFVEPSLDILGRCDLVFFATPNGIAMQQVPQLLEAGVKVIDLAADFRIKDPELWSQWYGMEHACPDLIEQAIYGLPEVNREQIATASLVANPGCYPTAVQLGYLPLLEAGVIDSSALIADTKSGVSGAGRQAAVGSLLCEAGENFKAYGVSGHRHQPEIEQGLTSISKLKGHNKGVELTFVPHLTPMIRGIHATLYSELTLPVDDLQAMFEQRYADEPFVDVMPAGSLPETRSVRGANTCRLAIYRPQGRQRVVVLSVIDNLVKGAAGQALQNMNIMFGFAETAGLDMVAMMP